MQYYLPAIFTGLTTLFSGFLLIYFQTKAKNQADKEDLKELTEIVEKAKQKSSEEIELLKSTLNTISNKQVILFGDEKESLVDFFSKLNAWVWDVIHLNLSEYNHTNVQDLSIRLSAMASNYHEVNISFAKVKLLVKSDELIQLGHKTIIQALDLHQNKESSIHKAIRILKMERILTEQFIERNKVDSISRFLAEQSTKNNKELKELIDNVRKSQSVSWELTIGLVNEFKDLAKAYLNT